MRTIQGATANHSGREWFGRSRIALGGAYESRPERARKSFRARYYEPAFTAVAIWFERSRERALLLTFVADFASAIFLLVASRSGETLGWRVALLVLASILAVTPISAHVFILRRAAELGLLRDVRKAPRETEAPRSRSTIRRTIPTFRPRRGAAAPRVVCRRAPGVHGIWPHGGGSTRAGGASSVTTS